jgi:hypothetical protein
LGGQAGVTGTIGTGNEARIMTARTVTFNGVHIDIQGEDPKEVLKQYIMELQRAGHAITKTKQNPWGPWRCKCGAEFRFYKPVGEPETSSLFSDIPEGSQCPRRHMNVFGGES